MKLNTVLFITLIMLFSACTRKELPQQESGTPVFKVSGTFNGSAFNLSAGVNGIVQNASLEQNEFGVYEYTSVLSQTGCDSCSEYLSVRLYGRSAMRFDEVPGAEDIFLAGNYFLSDFGMRTDHPNRIQFVSEVVNNASYLWDFGDGSTSTQPNPVHEFEFSGIYHVDLQITTPSGTDHIQQSITVNEDRPQYVPFRVKYGMNTVTFSRRSSEPHMGHAYWRLDGDIISDDPDFIYTTNDSVVHTICLDHDAEISDYCYRFNAQQPDAPLANFYTTLLPSPNSYNRVLVQYRDREGHNYYSADFVNDPQNSSFEVISVTPYNQTLNGLPVVLVKCRFTANMYRSGGGPSNDIRIENAEATLAFVLQ
jgi:PKD repeat protein